VISKAAADPPRHRGRGLPWLVGGAVLALHAALAATVPQPVHFDKYPTAARLFLAGQMPAERTLDFSPLYLGLVELWGRLGWPARPGIIVLQLGLVALVAAL
jgi:hypothetical protein